LLLVVETLFFSGISSLDSRVEALALVGVVLVAVVLVDGVLVAVMLADFVLVAVMLADFVLVGVVLVGVVLAGVLVISSVDGVLVFVLDLLFVDVLELVSF
jgi:hypothetical protein